MGPWNKMQFYRSGHDDCIFRNNASQPDPNLLVIEPAVLAEVVGGLGLGQIKVHIITGQGNSHRHCTWARSLLPFPRRKNYFRGHALVCRQLPYLLHLPLSSMPFEFIASKFSVTLPSSFALHRYTPRRHQIQPTAAPPPGLPCVP